MEIYEKITKLAKKHNLTEKQMNDWLKLCKKSYIHGSNDSHNLICNVKK